MECSEYSCIKPVFAKGLCHGHYDLQRQANLPKCSYSGCDQPIHAKGLCNKHYRRELQKGKTECEVKGCGRTVHANGLCSTHYTRQRRHGNLDPTRPSDWGGKGKHQLHHAYGWIKKKRGVVHICQKWLDDFWTFVEDVGDKPSKRHRLYLIDEDKGYVKGNTYWKEPVRDEVLAKNKREYQAKYIQRMREENPEKFRNYQFKNKYGMTLDDYNEMLVVQNGLCAICRQKEIAVNRQTQEPRNLAVDHCHESKEVRGLLCSNCNTGLGSFKDSKDMLLKAIAYLDKFS